MDAEWMKHMWLSPTNYDEHSDTQLEIPVQQRSKNSTLPGSSAWKHSIRNESPSVAVEQNCRKSLSTFADRVAAHAQPNQKLSSPGPSWNWQECSQSELVPMDCNGVEVPSGRDWNEDDLVPCPNCHRTFLPGRLEVHLHGCHRRSPAKASIKVSAPGSPYENKTSQSHCQSHPSLQRNAYAWRDLDTQYLV